jgi:hypothetical protein
MMGVLVNTSVGRSLSARHEVQVDLRVFAHS